MNALNEWREKQALSYAELARKLSLAKGNVVRRYCLPLDHQNFQIPDRRVMLRIWQLTGGAVDANSFYGLTAVAEATGEAAE